MKIVQTSRLLTFILVASLSFVGWIIPIDRQDSSEIVSVDQKDEYDIPEQDIVHEVTMVLVESYEKLVGATVCYYVMQHNPVAQQSLHHQITHIIAQDTGKVVSLLGNKFMRFLIDKNVSTYKKVGCCGLILGMMLGVKIGLDLHYPYLQKELQNSQILQAVKDSYVADKFGNYG